MTIAEDMPNSANETWPGGAPEPIAPPAVPCKEISDPDRLCKNPVASVVMLTYNHEPHIREAVESVARQKTEFPFELIIGEDCSTDATREVILECQKRFPDLIRVLVSEKNVGMLQNLERVNAHTRGAYVAFCEGDDFWTDPAKLQRQVRFLTEHPGYGAICTSCAIEKNGRIVGRTPGIDEETDVDLSQLLFANVIATLTVCCRRTLYSQYEKGESNRFRAEKMGDLPCWCWLSLHSKIRYVPECTATYRHLEESASHSKSAEKTYRFELSALRIRAYFMEFAEHAVQRKLVSVWVIAMLPKMLRFVDADAVSLLRALVCKYGSRTNLLVMKVQQALYPLGAVRIGVFLGRMGYFAQEVAEAGSLSPLCRRVLRKLSFC